jgi:hypothetical protein
VALEGSISELIPSKATKKEAFRIAIHPFDAPSNVSGGYPSQIDLGEFFADELKSSLLSSLSTSSQSIPTSIERPIERDWSGRREDSQASLVEHLYRGAIAGYDAIITGSLNESTDLSSLTTRVRVIDLRTKETVSLLDMTLLRDEHIPAFYESKLPVLRSPPGREAFKRLAICTAEILSR